MLEKKMCFAQCLFNHPLTEEKMSYRINYINIIEYFTRLYSSDDDFSNSMLQLYKNKLDVLSNYRYCENSSKKFFENKYQSKTKLLIPIRYRYNLLFDCLYINAFNAPEKAASILEKFKRIYNSKYYVKMDRLYDILYNDIANKKFTELSDQIKCWKSNESFLKKKLNRILITANMSAGKSTLINALIGKKVNRTQNDSCTAKIHYIYNKPFEDNLVYEYDYEMNLDATFRDLMDDNLQNDSSDINVGAYFKTFENTLSRMCIIDTPGVNSALDKEHKELTEKVISEKNYDKLIYVLNAENIGTTDDIRHLNFIFENVKDKPIEFVINKLDTYNKSEDSVTEKNFFGKKRIKENRF